MQRRVALFLELGLIITWLGLIFLLSYRHYISGSAVSPVQRLSGADFKKKEEWFGIYSNSGKMGFMKITVDQIGAEYRFAGSEEREVRIDSARTARVKTEFSFLTDPFFKVKTFESASEAAGNRTKARGEIKDNLLVAFLDINGQQRAIKRKLTAQPYSLFTLGQAIFEMGLGKGKRFNLPIINLLSFNVYNQKVAVEELVPIKIGNEVRTAFLLRVGEDLVWLTDGGFTLKEEYPSGIRYFAEPEDIAKDKASALFDYLSLPAIKTNMHIADPEKTSYAKFRISGIDGSRSNALNGGNQILKGEILEIYRAKEEEVKKRTYKLPCKGNDHPIQFLEPSAYVKTDSPIVVQNSKAYVRLKNGDAWEYSQYLTYHLFMDMRKEPIPSIIDSGKVSVLRAGECNEHTVLFTAYARAAGLPARMVGGLTYIDGRFYYHTWPEVWMDGWVPVDPTRGQVIADAMHIRLVEGDMDKLTEMGDILKDIKIDILEAR